jgi:ubiquitin-conjugating enzyme E2 Q
VLQVGSAVGCCEIINQTDQFVTAEPYYVVNNIDWIQCRYLFVHINVHTLAESGLPFLQQTSRGSLGKLRQDPARHLLGPQSKPIDVPRSGVPIERFRMFPYLAPRWILDGENKSEEWTVGSSKGVDVDGILG